MNSKSKEISTFVCKDDDCEVYEGKIYIIHLFVYPNSDYNVFKSLIDGYGHFYIPNVDPNIPISEQRFWAQGRLLAIFEGKVDEAEVVSRLESTGFIGDEKIEVIECDRAGLKFSSSTD